MINNMLYIVISLESSVESKQYKQYMRDKGHCGKVPFEAEEDMIEAGQFP